MLGTVNYYRRFPGDYLRDTIHLSAAEDGMYGRLLDKQYSSEKPLPLDRTILYAMVRAHSKADQKAVESVLAQFFVKTRYGFTNRRAKKELQRAKEISDIRSSAGKQRTKRPANAEQMLCNPDSRLQRPEPEKTSLKYTVSRGKREAFNLATGDERENLALSLFEKFWIDYPKKLDREEALKLWLGLSPLDQTVACEAVVLWAKSEEWKDPLYVPSPENFLRKRRWESRPVVKAKTESLHEQLRKLEEEHGIH